MKDGARRKEASYMTMLDRLRAARIMNALNLRGARARIVSPLLNRCERQYRKWVRLLFRLLPKRDITTEDEAYLLQTLDFRHMAAAKNVQIMSRFTIRSREEFARKTRSMVLYAPEEAKEVKRLEEEAALKAAPQGYDIKTLNGLNIGCGNRRVSRHLLPVDIMRESKLGPTNGEHHAFLDDALLANPDDLPFKEESIDYIIALHMLEHVANPMEILRYWSTLLKPGGGIGLVLPNYEYTWSAHGDSSQFGHKWNTNAQIFEKLYQRDLKDWLSLERIDMLPYRISFDVILRKPGQFQPFQISGTTSVHSGAELFRLGLMVSDMDGRD